MKIFIAQPVLRAILPPTAATLLDEQKHLINAGHSVTIDFAWGDGVIARARNGQFRKFMDGDCDFYCQWSDDISKTDGIKGSAYLPLIESKYEFTGLLYPKSTFCKPEEQPTSNALKNPETGGTIADEDGWIKMGQLSGGVWCVARPVCEAMVKAGWEQPFETNANLSEDFIFCDRWRSIGGEIWANPHLALAHWGWYPYMFKG